MSRRNILVTGNLGYIGSVLVPELAARGYRVTGLDTGFYDAPLETLSPAVVRQFRKDIRDVTSQDVEGFDGVIHLAALSNDPLGELAPGLTEEINLNGSMKLAGLAKEAGVKRFVYASSQSMYGVSDSDMELDEDRSDKNPVTAYAKTKWEAELALKKLHSRNFTVTCMRPSTVFGASPNLRCDIVFNNLVASAYTTGKIEIKSDGTPWRPVVHVLDVAQAFIAGLEAPAEKVGNHSYNVGIPNGNFTVRDLACAAQEVVPGSALTFTGEHGSDSRTYRVSFQKILNDLKDYFRPEYDLIRGGRELVAFFDRIGFTESDFRGGRCHRLLRLEDHIRSGRLDKDLRWKE